LKKLTKSSALPKKKRRWIIFGIILIVFVAIVAFYETQQELRRKHSQLDLELTVDELAQLSISKLKSYYRSHDLPSGWEIGEMEKNIEITPAQIIIPIYFSPGIRSSRHGKSSLHGEINHKIACPTDKGPWEILKKFSLLVTINDKNGQVGSINCRQDQSY
tara:strand:+ start:3515 stop:3997 length:483 start_codon:yes stop_codon:yes gene_type:complete